MKTYVTQLIYDIEHAHRVPLTAAEKETFTFEEEMEAIENYAEGRNIPPPLSVQCGITVDQFPPEDQLEDDEIRNILDALQQMFLSRNMSIDMPKNVPIRKAYLLIIDLLNKEAWYFPTGTLHHDFCTGYAPECALGEYCPCLGIWNEQPESHGQEEI